MGLVELKCSSSATREVRDSRRPERRQAVLDGAAMVEEHTQAAIER